ncbi:unnamed protein product [Microthlaspi erraticum]|uniref:Uncharacterized protein n=1 Tax=Microthlaspi erraticum TaxID=1685480 RepID=A0A6D2JGV1_9BRAS|nr:unnamed protein product [Microthlaspi erraticum]
MTTATLEGVMKTCSLREVSRTMVTTRTRRSTATTSCGGRAEKTLRRDAFSTTASHGRSSTAVNGSCGFTVGVGMSSRDGGGSLAILAAIHYKKIE